MFMFLQNNCIYRQIKLEKKMMIEYRDSPYISRPCAFSYYYLSYSSRYIKNVRYDIGK